MFPLKATDVKLNVDLPRFRKEMGDVKSLMESIRTLGQLQPVIISRNNELIVGGRRLAACLMGNLPVLCEYNDAVDPLTMRELEVEENIQRKQFTPAEEIEAIDELHRLKTMKYGQATSGREGGWRQEDTAQVLGISRPALVENLVLAEVIKNFPELRGCKTKKEIKQAAKGMVRIAENMAAMDKFEDILKSASNYPQVLNEDAMDAMKLVPDGSVDLLLTDPPYGQEIEESKIGLGGHTGGMTVSGVTFDDSKMEALGLYATLASESFRFCSPTAHAFIFVCPEHFDIVRTLFQGVGWDCYIKPMIWYKKGVGQTNQPSRWPSSCYEMILFCRKDAAKLVKEGQPDVLDIPVVPWQYKIHPTEKPIELGIELIQRTTRPGGVLYDPFAGSGAFLIAGFKEYLLCYGVEKSTEIYANLCKRVAEHCQEGDDDGQDEIG